MFKVVLKLKQLSIRLKECELDVFLRKDRQNLPLCNKLTILNGSCLINILREFYVSADDPKLSLVFYLLQRNQKKYAGDVTLNVLEWQENVIHTTQTRIHNSPDKNSRLTFQFYYFKDQTVNDGRSFFLTREKHRQQYNIIQSSNKELNREKIKLEEEVYHWHKKNEALESGCHDMMVNLQEREIYYHNRVGYCQEIINQYTEACQKHRQKREGLMRLAEEHGLTRTQMESE